MEIEVTDFNDSASLINKAIDYKIDDYMWYVACTHQRLRKLKVD